MADLTGQRVLIVGGTAGIGFACAKAMQSAGATVTVAGCTAGRGQEAAKRLARPLFNSVTSKLFGKAEAMAHLGVAEPDDIAELAVFLASSAAKRITGQTISVTGGISAI